jgi:PAS domain S-box-containing protein
MKATSNRTFLAGFVGALVLLGGVVWFGWVHSVRMQETVTMVARTEKVRYELSKLLSDIQDVEVGGRGFVLTGDSKFLVRFEAALREVNDQFRTVRRLTLNNPRQQANCDSLFPLIDRRIAAAQSNVVLRRNSGFEAAQQAVASGTGETLMDQIRVEIGRMQEEERTLLDQRSAVAQQEASITNQLMITGTALSVTLLIAVFAFVLRENRLRQKSEAELDRFFTLSLDMLCIASADGYFKRISPVFTQALGWSVEEILAQPFMDLVHPDDRAATLREVERQVAAGENVLNFENRYRHKDGSWRVLSWKSVPQPGGMMYAVARDITEQKRIEEQVTENLKMLAEFKAALDEHAIVAITDARGKITYVNDKFCAISKYAREELLGQDHRIINSGHHPKAFIRGLWETITSGRVWKGELKNRAKDGTFYWVDTTIVPFLGTDGKPIQFIAIRADITERKEAAEQIVRLNAELKQHAEGLEAANKELESFSYSVSHDLRAPLRHVQGYADMLTKALGDQLADKPRRYLKTITDASVEMGQLIDDLLDFSRMAKVELHEKRIPLDELMRDTLRAHEMAAKDRNIVWKIAPLPEVMGDAAVLRQVFANLVGNAVKYTRGRNPAQIEIGVAGAEDGRTVLFVRDNGAGFDPKYIHKLFGVFSRLHRAEEFEGTGIGLAIVRRVISRHGGRVWAEGKVGEGATFYFTLKGVKS